MCQNGILNKNPLNYDLYVLFYMLPLKSFLPANNLNKGFLAKTT